MSTSSFTPRMRRLIIAALLGTTMLSGLAVAAQPENANPPAMQTVAQGLPGSFADLVQQVSSAVVTITSEKVAADRQAPGLPEFQFPPGSPFENLFKQFERQFGKRRFLPQKVTALGSGFVIDPAGYVVTNNHVIEGADKVSVTLQDGTRLDAKIIGHDEQTDLALLKVDGGKPLPYLQWDDSDTARVGDWVLAVGNPFGLGGTVTTGIISARGRDIQSGPYDDFLQIDASINQGNSGGPTLDMQGKVIGINTAIVSPNGGSVGIGFAIPSNMAKTVVAQLREHGSIERGWLGVQIQPVTSEIADSLGLSEAKGALVADVIPDSPAAAARLRSGDVIVSFDGKPVETAKDLIRMVAASRPDVSLPIVIQRDGKQQTISIALRQQPQDQEKVAALAPHPSADTVLGMHLARLNKQIRAELGLSNDVQGVVVMDLAAEAPDLPIQPGDVITTVGNAPVKSPADVAAKVQAAKKSGRNAVLLRINRQGTEQFVAVPIKNA